MNTITPREESYKDASARPIRGTVADIIFILFIVGGQSYFFGLINPQWFYVSGFFDIRMPLILYCTILTFLMLRNRWVLSFFPSSKTIFFIAAYVIIQFIFSSIQFGIYNAFKVFRYYCLPLVGIGPLLYVIAISRERQLRLLRWVFIATVVQGFFYILYIAGFSVFYTPTEQSTFYGLDKLRFNQAFPLFTSFVISASLLFIIYEKRFSFSISFFILIYATILYATRSVIILIFFSGAMIALLAMFKKGSRVLGIFALFSIFAFLGFIFFITIFPDYSEFVFGRFLEITGDEGLRGAANYKLRISYLENVLADMTTLKNTLFGHGYEAQLTRDLWCIGTETTDIGMQGDAPIAGLLFTEGFVGLALRALPFLILFFIHLRLFLLSNNSEDIIISTLIIVMISGNALAWLQTTALRELPLSILPYFILHNLHSSNRSVLYSELSNSQGNI